MNNERDRLAGLLAHPLDDFVRARDELVRATRAAGDKDGAAAVKAMRKPSVPAWALDQVARERPDVVDRLISAGRHVREVSERALAGDASALRSATTELHAATSDIVSAASEVLRVAGRTASPPTLDRIAATARAAAADDSVGAALRAGLLTEDADPAGFGFDGLRFEPPPGPSRSEIEQARQSARDELEKARRRLAQADDDVAEAEQRLDAARRRQADAAMAVADAEAEVSDVSESA